MKNRFLIGGLLVFAALPAWAQTPPKPFAPIVLDQAKVQQFLKWSHEELTGAAQDKVVEWLTAQEQLAQAEAPAPKPAPPTVSPPMQPRQSMLPGGMRPMAQPPTPTPQPTPPTPPPPVKK